MALLAAPALRSRRFSRSTRYPRTAISTASNPPPRVVRLQLLALATAVGRSAQQVRELLPCGCKAAGLLAEPVRRRGIEVDPAPAHPGARLGVGVPRAHHVDFFERAVLHDRVARRIARGDPGGAQQ